MNIFPLFSVPLSISKINLSHLDIKAIESIPVKRRESDNCYLSDNIRILESNSLNTLKNTIIKELNTYFYEVLGISKTISLNITNSWKIVHKLGDWAPKHKHYNSIVSGILYIDVFYDSGDIIFYCDNRKSVLNNGLLELPFEVTQYNYTTWELKPENNMLILFPSFLEHSVTKSTNMNNRICISFDTFISGTVGNDILNKLKINSPA